VNGEAEIFLFSKCKKFEERGNLSVFGSLRAKIYSPNFLPTEKQGGWRNAIDSLTRRFFGGRWSTKNFLVTVTKVGGVWRIGVLGKIVTDRNKKI
jgi:hypothetical protein